MQKLFDTFADNLIETFCIVNEVRKDRNGKPFIFNRNILYCKFLFSSNFANFSIYLIETFCIVNVRNEITEANEIVI